MHACASCRVETNPGICKVCRGFTVVAPIQGAVACRHCDGRGIHNCAECRVGSEFGICQVCKGSAVLAPS